MKSLIITGLLVNVSFAAMGNVKGVDEGTVTKPYSATQETTHEHMTQTKKHKLSSETVEFSEGKATLSEDQASKLTEMVMQLAKRGEDTKIEIAAFSDQPFPQGENKLSDKQIELAEKRIDEVKKVLKRANFDGEVEAYNLAEKSSWLADAFDTDESELKSIFAKEKVDKDTLNERFEKFKASGEAGKAVIIVSKKLY